MPNLLLKSAGILLVAALVAFAGLLFSMPELSAQEADSDGEPAATPTPVPPTATPIPPTPTPTPPPTLTLLETSGAPGWYITISGNGFKGSAPVRSARFGGIDVLGSRSPMPWTNYQGKTNFSIRIPDLDPGSYTIRVEVADSTASAVFTVTPTPTPTLILSSTSGAPGSTITLRGEGFRRWVPVISTKVGNIDVTYSPLYATNDEGMFWFDIIIPGLDPGRHTIEVQASGTTVGRNFTVTESDCALATGSPTPMITPSQNSGVPGATITVKGTGFKAFMPVRRLSVGSIEVYPFPYPFPYPHTNCDGEMEFDIRIPDLAPGSHVIEVQVNDTTVSENFTVTSASNPVPTPRPTATPQPTQRPTATPQPTQRPTATPQPTPRPTATPYPTPTPTPSPPIVIPVVPDSNPAPPQLPGGSEPPHIFTGMANLNGRPAGQGIAIDAYDGGRLIGATVTQAGGRYTIHVHRSQGVITFRVNQQAAAESWTTWQQGQVTPGFNLTAAAGSSESDPSRLFAALPDLVRAFAFDNATKQWDFFDPVVPEVSTLTRLMPGNIYWLLVSHSTRLMLNGAERDLSCVGDDCWNLIVW